MARIYLVGFMGVGKSNAGRKLARMLNYTLLDLDDAFEKKYKINIDSFFHKYDEDLFRKLELELLESTFKLEDVVISTGGGTPCFYDSIDSMNAHGITVYLEMPPEALVKRLKHARKPRPLIKGKKANLLDEFVTRILEERKSSYKKAQITVDAVNIDLEKLCKEIKGRIEGVV